MKLSTIFLALILFTTFYSAHSQLKEDFSDGNFNDSTQWTGDTSRFVIDANNRLQLAAALVEDQSYLSTPCEINDEAEWSFEVNLGFNPSSKNYLDV